MAAFKTHNFLPEVFRTDTNKKFLNATLDQLISEPNFKKVSGYIGRKFAPTYKSEDGYVEEATIERQNYQVEPGVVVTDPTSDVTKFYSGYTDLVNKVKYYGGDPSNHSRSFTGPVYSYSGNFDFDKFVNFSQYYWLPNGPDEVVVSSSGVPLNRTYDVKLNPATNTYYFGTSTKETGNTELVLAYGGVYKFNLDSTSSNFWIQAKPSVIGRDPDRLNINVRDVYGVKNNGAESGTVTFKVPQPTTQNKFINMPMAASADYATTIQYKDIQGAVLSEFNQKFGGLDGPSGNINNRTLIFVGKPDPADKSWETATVQVEIDDSSSQPFSFSLDGTNYMPWAVTVPVVNISIDNYYWTAATTRVTTVDSTGNEIEVTRDSASYLPWGANVYDGTLVQPEDRTKVWTISVNEDGIINLTPSIKVNQFDKVYIKSGTANATKLFYIGYYNDYEEMPLITAPLDTLYYQSSTVATAAGRIKLVAHTEDNLNPAVDIEGKVAYTSPNGVPFTNGLKIRFDSTALAPYANTAYYVTGVGKHIKLVAVNDLVAVETWKQSSVVHLAEGTGYQVNDYLTIQGGEFITPAAVQVLEIGTNGKIVRFQIMNPGEYSVLPANPVEVSGGSGVGAKLNLFTQPPTQDYLTLNRASIDLNAWARNNRWFHIDIIKFAAEFNGNELLIDQTYAGKRPIIEFQNNVKLYNYGTVAKAPIDILDAVVTSAYTQIESAPVNNPNVFVKVIDGSTVTLRNKDRVIFSNDSNLNVRNKIYDFSIIDISDDVWVPKYVARITESADSVVLPNNAIIAKANLGNVNEFWYNGIDWVASQQKIKLNQAPLFDVFNVNGISFSDKTYYTNNDFTGTPIFSYKEGTGPVDPNLGFPLSYRSFNNVGDIQFTNNFDSGSFKYLVGPTTHSELLNTGFLHSTDSIDSYTVNNGWTTTQENTKQYQLISYVADGLNNAFEIDILPVATDTIPNIKVLVNGKHLTTDQFGMEQIGVRYAVIVGASLLTPNATVDILIYSTTISKLGFYQIPTNLDNNAANANFANLTLGQMRNHLVTLANNSTNIIGDVPGSNNLRDVDIKPHCGSILKHAAPLIYSELFLVDNQMNFVDSIRLAQREYSKFKNKFLELASQIEVDVSNISATADKIIKIINGIKNINFPWYYSDMVPQGDAKVVLPPYTVLDPRIKNYEITSIFNDTALSNKAVLVYLTRVVNGVSTKVLLAKDQDYTFSKTSPSVAISDEFNLNYNDILTIVEYSTTDGNYVPETPSKLGLYPKFVPSKFLDNTYLTPINVIQGHDGSITPAFNDYRDDLLLELELRIYNNIKVVSTVPSLASIIPGKFRITPYSLSEYNRVLTSSFLAWAGTNRLDFTTNKYFESNNAWTWNYKNFKDTINGEFLPGSWKAIFRWYYDTERPHSHPWEMLGFTDKPNWWQDRYGPAPYTGGNLTLWGDLSKGYIHAGDRQGIDSRYARPGLLQVIPVDDAGNLISPEKFAVLDFDSAKANASFAVGDVGPTEAAWRRSSDYAYAVQVALALLNPAFYFAAYVNVDRFTFNNGINQYLVNATNQHIRPIDIEVNGYDNNGIVRTAGYINWISDYLKNLGINSPQEVIKAQLKNVSVQLNYKVAGYTDKKFLKILAEQGSPSSTNTSIVIPDENYRIILNKSVPVDRVTYSGVIIQKSPNGFTVSGYDLLNPYFTIIPSIRSNNAYTVTANKATAVIYKDYQPITLTIAYGTEFADTQQVTDFLMGYQRHLQSQGFVFIDYDYDLGQKKDWVLSVKEFLTWTQQGWKSGNVLIVSPIKDKLRVSLIDSVVDEITNAINGSKLLDPNFAVIQNTKFTVVRSDNNFDVTSIAGQTIAFASLNLVQYEHVILFDNTTVFNDVIYSSESGNRQYRLKFIGNKTAEWTGVMAPPGFVYNSPDVELWIQGKDYKKGQLVNYKDAYYTAMADVTATTEFDNSQWAQVDKTQIKTGLLPNYANIAKTFESYYDVDNQPYDETLQFYSNGLTGFCERSYLSDLLFEAETQSKFYQGYIKQKGTANAVTALAAAQINGSATNINIYEEWAVRVGEYGATDSNQFVEIVLNDQSITSNPATVQMLEVSASADPTATPYYPKDVYKSSKQNSPYMFDEYVSSADKVTLPTAGYPNLSDVDATIFDLENYRDLSTSLANIGTGYTIWTAKDFSGSWNVYRVSETNTSVTMLSYNMDNVATVTTSAPSEVIEGDIIAIKGFSVTVDDELTSYDGFYQVYSIVDSLNFTVVLTTGYEALRNVNVIYDSAMLFKLTSSRVQTVSEINSITPKFGWTSDDFIWVDSALSGWGVYRRTEPWEYSNKTLLNVSEYVGNDQFGAAVKVSKNGLYMFASAPTNESGKIASFIKQPDSTWIKNSSINVKGTGTVELGTSIELTEKTLILSAPKSNLNAGQLFVYTVGSQGTNIAQVITSPVPMTGNGFSTTIATSEDGNWLYVGEPGAAVVRVYNWVVRNSSLQSISRGQNSATLAVMTTDVNALLVTGANPYIPGIDFTITNNVITFTATLVEDVLITFKSYYALVGSISVPGISGSDRFGASLICDAAGEFVVIGSSNYTLDGIINSGIAHVFNRSIEEFVSRGTSNSINTLYTLPINPVVKFNDVVQPTSSYTIADNSVGFNSTVPAGVTIKVETNKFVLVDTLSSTTSAIGQNFGIAADICNDASNIYVGAPGYTDLTYYNGALVRFTNGAKNYGTITGTVPNPTVTAGDVLRVNGVAVPFNGTTLADVVVSINSAAIPGITATNVDAKLAISSSLLGENKLSILPGPGSAMHDLGLTVYTATQTIKHPAASGNEFFGVAVSISDDERSLAISSRGAATVERITFDQLDTQFDSGSTGFSDAIPNSGAIYVFDLVENAQESISNPSNFEFTQTLAAPKLATGDKFGQSIYFRNNSIFVGVTGDDEAAANGGSVIEFINAKLHKGWDLVRQETPQIDYLSLDRAFLYNRNTQSILARLDVYDPAKGKILGVVEQDLDYIAEKDPAVYNNGGSNYSEEFHWSNLQVGKTWWDTSKIRYINYEQGDLAYKSKHWGEIFPGSEVKVYEWVESTVIPGQYVANGGNGVPKYEDDSNFVTYMYVEPVTGIIKSKYYYWVSDKTTVDVNTTKRVSSVYSLQQAIASPKDQKLPFIAAIESNAVLLFNTTQYLTGSSVVLHIDHTPVQNTNIIHTEYELIKENASDDIPNRIVAKLQDSLAGIDSAGYIVPSPNLGVANRYGIEIRPRQTMFVNRAVALENFVKYANTIFTLYPIADLRDISKLYSGEPQPAGNSGAYDKVVTTKDDLFYIDTALLSDSFKVLVNTDADNNGLWAIYQWSINKAQWILIRIQSYLTSLYFVHSDWYDATYDNTVKPTYTVQTYPAIAALALKTGDTVKVLDSGSGRFAIYRVNSLKELDRVASQNGTIQLLPTLYNLSTGNMGYDNDNFDTIRYDQNPTIETRYIFSAVVEDILIGDLKHEFNKLFFSLVNYMFTEQATPDWIFKTSFLSVVHKIRDLAQYPSYIKDNQTYYEDYINEVKPYRTSIREYLPTQSTSDTSYASATDFDLPSYYDSITSTYRSPDGSRASDEILLATPAYSAWNDNYAYSVVEVSVSNPGIDFTIVPEVVINGGGGSGATAIATIANGQIANIIITNPGKGYTSTPTVTVNGNGTGAVLVALLRNVFKNNAAQSYNTVRSIDTDLKFDRYTYTSDVVEWEANVSYSANVQATSNGHEYLANGNLISYSNELYIPIGTVSGQSTFDYSQFEKLTAGNVLVANNNRIMGYYQPSDSMPAKSLTQLVNGIEYPGILVNGDAYVQSDSTIDTIVSSEYSDLALGTRPEDINIDGGDYVDTFSSHAPEELLPGRIYESVDIQVHTISTYGFSSNVFSITRINIQDVGFGYSANTVNVSINGITNANVTPVLASNGAITSITINNGGYGLTSNSNPTIVITGANVAPAKATAYVTQDLHSTVGYRTFVNMNDALTYARIASSTTLTADLQLTDTEISVADASILSTPNIDLAKPGKVFINGEVIAYYTVDLVNNKLGQLRRAVDGTGAPTLHKAGVIVEDSGENQIIPGGIEVHNTTWLNRLSGFASLITDDLGNEIVDDLGNKLITPPAPLGAVTDGLGLMGSTTVQAKFIKGFDINT